MRKIEITDVSLRDGIQSLLATRVRTEDMLDIVEILDKCGFYSLEVWGGATFDVCLRFLKEDPWERLRKFKERAKNTKLEMLLRGQNWWATDTIRMTWWKPL
jgi:Pyruvate/oxaloacetate carboxyltransferase